MTSPEVQNFALLCRALSVLDPTTGEFLEHRQLHRDPKFKPVWDKSYANELGWLCQGIGTGASPTSKRVEGTNTFFSSITMISRHTNAKKFATRSLSAKSVGKG